MIHKKIYNLFPYINRDFLEYPLEEEGYMIPFLHFWITNEMEIETKCEHLNEYIDNEGFWVCEDCVEYIIK